MLAVTLHRAGAFGMNVEQIVAGHFHENFAITAFSCEDRRRDLKGMRQHCAAEIEYNPHAIEREHRIFQRGWKFVQPLTLCHRVKNLTAPALHASGHSDSRKV